MMGKKSFILVGRGGALVPGGVKNKTTKILLAAEMMYYFAKTNQTRDPEEATGNKQSKKMKYNQMNPNGLRWCCKC